MTPFNFSEFPILRTKRLILRELAPEDAEDVFVFRSDPEVQKYNDVPMQDIAEALQMIKHLAEGHAAEERIIWAITLKGDDTVIGLCGFNYWSHNHNRAAIGYDLAQSHWGQGIGYEAVREMLRFGFDQMQLHRVEAHTIADNAGSVNMLRKLGFHLEGLRREYSLEDDGIYHDGSIYGLLRTEFYNT